MAESSRSFDNVTRQIAREEILNNQRRESFKSYIIHLYGEETLYNIRKLEKLKRQRVSLLCSLAFLLRCRDHDIIPKFARIRHHIQSQRAKKIIRHAARSLVKERIHHTHITLDRISKQILALHLQTYANLRPSDIEWIDNSIRAQTEHLTTKNSSRQIHKFSRLSTNKNEVINLKSEKLVVNLSNRELEAPLISALSKGLNFSPSPRNPPIKGIISGIEQVIHHLPAEAADEVRTEVCQALRKAAPPKRNLTVVEFRALQMIRQDASIVILPADKGNATVAMQRWL